MAQTHELKTATIHFNAIARGDKTFEIRLNDRDFQAGDTLVLKDYGELPPPMVLAFGSAPPMPGTSKSLGYTGREMRVTVSHVFSDTSYGINPGYVILSFPVAGVVTSEFVTAAEARP